MVTTSRGCSDRIVRVSTPSNDSCHSAHRIRMASIIIDDTPTDFIVQPFSDRIFVIVTQLNKLGTIIAASVDTTLAGAESFSVQVLIGKRDIPEVELCARSIMSAIAASGCRRPLLLSLALKQHSMSTIRPIIAQIRDMPVW